jgi:hypothetical protein
MTDHARGVRVAFALVTACALWLGGCGQRGLAEKLPQDSPLLVETSQTSLRIENRAGLALTDLNVVIVPFGPLQFSARISRFEPSERRDIPLNTFRSRDGTSFNPRFHKPKSVRISGRDTAGKPYEIEMPWS